MIKVTTKKSITNLNVLSGDFFIMARIAVIGAGYRGFCDALALCNEGHSVTIIDSAPFFGGIMNSIVMGDFVVDKGVHFFNSMPPAMIDIVTEIMDGKVKPIGFWSRGVYGEKVTENFSLPNLESENELTKSKILNELLDLAAKNAPASEAHDLQEYFNSNFGQTAGRIFGDIFEGIYHTKACDAEQRAVKQTSLHRVKFLDDAKMMVLKDNPWLNDHVAARREALGKIDDLTSVYPSDGNGMKGWCTKASAWLEAKGVRILLNTKITKITPSEKEITISSDQEDWGFDRVVWSNDEVDDFAKMLGKDSDVGTLLKGTPLVFYSVVTKAEQIREFTYHQNFDPSSAMFRAAAAGYYGNQIDANGNSFITVECTANLDSEIWRDPNTNIQKIWAECKRDNIVDQDAEMLDYKFVKIPTSYKIRLNGYQNRFESVCDWVSEYDKRLICRKSEPFFRREIYLDSLNLPDQIDA